MGGESKVMVPGEFDVYCGINNGEEHERLECGLGICIKSTPGTNLGS